MAKITKENNTPLLELNLEECEELLGLIIPEREHLQKKCALDEILQNEGMLLGSQQKRASKRKIRMVVLDELYNAIVEIGNML